ncbi:MAG: extracellular solute-binding protein [Treponema sp.]|nr:extracellular solute-binding protein [Treponema sp.]
MKKSALAATAVIVVIMSIFLLVGAGNRDSSASQQGSTGRQRVTFKTVVPTSAYDPSNLKNVESIKYFEDNFNVSFDVEIGPGDPANFDQRIRLLATSGDLPDIIYQFNGIITELADEGFLLPITDSIFNMVPSLRDRFPQSQLERIKYKGVNYTFPAQMQSSYNAVYARGDWLEKLNITPPKTLTEFEAMLRAFTYNDPDGNGLNDTYGWGERNLIGGNFTTIFGAYGIIPQYWNEYNGQVYYGFTHPKIQEVLALLQRWYAEKLIDPEWITTNTDDWWGKIAIGKLGTFTAGISSYDGIMGRIKPNNPNGYVVTIPAPAGPSGKGGIHAFGDLSQGFALNKNIKNIDRLMEVVQFLYDPDNVAKLALGTEGKDYALNPEGGYKWLITDAERKDRGLGWYPVMLQTSNYFGMTPYVNLNLIEKLQTNFEKNAFDIYKDSQIPDAFNGFNRPQRDINLTDKYGDINSILLQGLFEVVCGKASVSDYQKYVDDWYNKGGWEVTQQANEDYQLMLSQRK